MERIVNGKTLSLKHFLNTRLKGKVIDGVGHYALYTMITYNNINTQFKSFLSKTEQNRTIYIPSSHEEKLKSGDNSFIRAKDYEQLEKTDNWILDILEYEIERYKTVKYVEFSVKGLSIRLEIYTMEILEYIDLLGTRWLLAVMGDELTYNNYMKLEKHKGGFKSKFNLAVNLLVKQKPNSKEILNEGVQYIYKVYL
ncbi:MAG: hypothetical protein AAF673_05970, partial [Pseudomonadota bacterium]